MAITLPTVANMISLAIDNHLKSPAFEQSIQDKPLLKILKKHQKTFGGGNDTLTIPVRGSNGTAGAGGSPLTLQTYSSTDQVDYGNPNNTLRVRYNWHELHMGLGVTLTELKRGGIHIIDSTSGLEGNVSRASDRDAYVLTDILEDKLSDFSEAWANQFNLDCWDLGATLRTSGLTSGATTFAGLGRMLYKVDAAPAANASVVGGLDPNTHAWWLNPRAIGIAATATPAVGSNVMAAAVQRIVRQMRRYGGKPRYALCGSAFLEALEAELRVNGNYTETGFAKGADISVGAIKHSGIEFMYDPTLDATISTVVYCKFCYIIDPERVKLRPMEGEDMKRHSPARPENVYAAYAAVTWTGTMSMDQRNAHGVMSIA